MHIQKLVYVGLLVSSVSALRGTLNAYMPKKFTAAGITPNWLVSKRPAAAPTSGPVVLYDKNRAAFSSATSQPGHRPFKPLGAGTSTGFQPTIPHVKTRSFMGQHVATTHFVDPKGVPRLAVNIGRGYNPSGIYFKDASGRFVNNQGAGMTAKHRAQYLVARYGKPAAMVGAALGGAAVLGGVATNALGSVSSTPELFGPEPAIL